MELSIDVLLYCRICKTDLPKDSFSPSEVRAQYHRCRACANRISREWSQKNRERANENGKRWRAANLELCNKRSVISGRKWREANPLKMKTAVKRYRIELKDLVFNHYGRSCACCSESNLQFLSIDHINNDGAEHRKELGVGGTNLYAWLKKNGFPEGFRTLCYNCNIGRAQNGGVCPHEGSRAQTLKLVK